MRRYLVVANQTVTEPHLLRKVRDCMAAGECSFHIVVPASSRDGVTWTEHEAIAEAQARLDAGLASFLKMGAAVTGEVGDPSPVEAVGDVLLHADYDEIILSTLPPGPSRWLKQDVVSRMNKRYDIPVSHVAAGPMAAQRAS